MPIEYSIGNLLKIIFSSVLSQQCLLSHWKYGFISSYSHITLTQENTIERWTTAIKTKSWWFLKLNIICWAFSSTLVYTYLYSSFITTLYTMAMVNQSLWLAEDVHYFKIMHSSSRAVSSLHKSYSWFLLLPAYSSYACYCLIFTDNRVI